MSRTILPGVVFVLTVSLSITSRQSSFAQSKPDSAPVVKSAQDNSKDTKKGVKSAGGNKKEDDPSKAVEAAAKAEAMARIKEAVDILRYLDKDSDNIDDPEMRIRTRVQVADALWPHDKENAIAVLKNSFQAIDEIKLSTLSSKDSTISGTASVKQLASEEARIEKIKEKLRHYVLQVFSSRDADLADSLAKSVSKKELASDLRLNLAANLAESDVDRAATITKDVAKSGELNSAIIRPLIAIRRKNADLADSIFLDTLNQVGRNKAYYTQSTLQVLGLYVIEFDEEKFASQNMSPNKAGRKAVEQFLRFAYQVIIYRIELQLNQQESTQNIGEISESYWMLSRLVPLFEELLPGEAALVKQELGKLSSALPNSQRLSLQGKPQEASQAAQTLQDLLSEADQPSSLEKKDMFYMRAAFLAVEQNDAEQAVFIANKIHNLEDKKTTISIVHYQAAMKAAFSKDIELAYQHAKEVSALKQRSLAFKELANLSIFKKDSALARRMLDEIEDHIYNGYDSQAEKALALLDVAEAFVKVDLSRSFEVTESMAKFLNNADFKSSQGLTLNESSSVKGKFRKTDVKPEHFKVEQLFLSLGLNDFTRAIAIAQGIDKKEISIPVKIAICKAILTTPMKSSQAGNSARK